MTLLLCDLAGWGKFMRAVGDDEAVATAKRYHAIVGRACDANGGRVVEVVADNALALFERPRDAVLAAITIRAALDAEPWIADEHRCPVASAVHSGRVVAADGGMLGSAALRVFKLCDLAQAGQILVSHSTEALLAGDVADFRLVDLGVRTMDGADGPVRLFAVAD